MGITNIPIEVLFEAQMMTMLKQLDREWFIYKFKFYK